jgi:short-subunit dehydrogenase
MPSLAGKVIIITGASAGIGKSLALLLAPLGVRLVLGARRLDRLEEIAKQTRTAGSETVVLACDVSRRADVDALAAAAVEKFGRIDIMVANAGYGILASIDDTTDAQFDDIVNTNIKGTFWSMQAASRQMRTQTPDPATGRRGHIIAVSSAAGRRSLPLFGIYSMTKAAQLSLCEAMRLELKPQGIYVSSVHPISTTTEFFDVASSKSQTKARGLGTTQSAETVCKKMIRLMKHPKPELWPHGLTRIGIVLAILMPRLADRSLAKSMSQRT